MMVGRTLHCWHGVRDRDEYIELVIHFDPDRIRPHQSVEIPSVSPVSDANPRFSSPDAAVIPTDEVISVDSTTVPLFAVLLLLATKCIDGHDLRRGIVGDGGVKPLSIMALFISLVRNVS